MKELLQEYRESRQGLMYMLKELDAKEHNARKEKADAELEEVLEVINHDKKIVKSMIRSVKDIIDWIESGVNPYFQQGVDSKHSYDIAYFDSMELIPDINEQLQEREELKLETDDKEKLRKIFNILTQRERDCVIYHIALGYSLSQVGEVLGGIKKSTVSTHIERARKKINDVVR